MIRNTNQQKRENITYYQKWQHAVIFQKSERGTGCNEHIVSHFIQCHLSHAYHTLVSQILLQFKIKIRQRQNYVKTLAHQSRRICQCTAVVLFTAFSTATIVLQVHITAYSFISALLHNHLHFQKGRNFLFHSYECPQPLQPSYINDIFPSLSHCSNHLNEIQSHRRQRQCVPLKHSTRSNNPEDNNLNNFPMAEIFALLGWYKVQIGSNYDILG